MQLVQEIRRRSKQQYPGLGREQERALAKGYVDLGLVDPKGAEAWMKRAGVHQIAKQLGKIRTTPRFIRDPHNWVAKHKRELERAIKRRFTQYWWEQDPSDPHKKRELNKILDALDKHYKVRLKKVSGRSGPGWLVQTNSLKRIVQRVERDG